MAEKQKTAIYTETVCCPCICKRDFSLSHVSFTLTLSFHSNENNKSSSSSRKCHVIEADIPCAIHQKWLHPQNRPPPAISWYRSICTFYWSLNRHIFDSSFFLIYENSFKRANSFKTVCPHIFVYNIYITYIRIYVYVFIHVLIYYIHVFMYNTYIYMCIYIIYICIYVWYIYIYKYVYMYTYIHVHALNSLCRHAPVDH